MEKEQMSVGSRGGEGEGGWGGCGWVGGGGWNHMGAVLP